MCVLCVCLLGMNELYLRRDRPWRQYCFTCGVWDHSDCQEYCETCGVYVTPIVLIFAMLAKCLIIQLVSCIVTNVMCLGMPLFRIIVMIVVVSIGVLRSVHGT